MNVNARYAILFEPVRIGPVTAKNRFYQVPHCNGMGYRDPSAVAQMRGVKAEGGWAVVCTEQVEIHPTSDINPFIELRLWDDRDIPMLAKMADRIHEHNALAGIELAYNGLNGPNLYGREVPMAPTALPVASFTYDPVQAREMDLDDIRNIRRWHRNAAVRGRRAGFDLVYVYAGHALGFFHHFLSRRYNQRTDEYGGSLENRVRLLREILIETKDAVGGACAVPCRISLDELMGSDGLERAEVEDMIGMLAELPDLWDVCLAGWENDSRTSRFSPEGAQEDYFRNIKGLTTKPVVGVGRYTSPDRMVSLVQKGMLDFIGCARPSIADPFLPKKIEENRTEDIRECIGCNICVSGDFTMSPIRCTQNPAMGEEWRRGWHPERIRPRESEKPVLVIGGGPAGMEAAQMLGKRGYDVALAESNGELGGRVSREASLPGLAAWIRVRDYRLQQLIGLPNVELFLGHELTADEIMELDYSRIALATGSYWRSDGVGHHWTMPIAFSGDAEILDPDQLIDGRRPSGRSVVIWDDDHYYMAGVLAELLATEGFSVSLVTPASEVSTWTRNTMEQHVIQRRLLEMGVTILPNMILTGTDDGVVEFSCGYTGAETQLEADCVVPVTSRIPNDTLYRDLNSRKEQWSDAGIELLAVLGDAQAPATIAHAVFAGRKFAEELDSGVIDPDCVSFRRELVALAD
ncbi:MAG: FAD-dependent oxidoreductase [Rhodobacteraceae bacterium]|nr:FAD-dependent oxidoreductase [Paracoccaceae bacterium]